jgi:hypothetical protein
MSDQATPGVWNLEFTDEQKLIQRSVREFSLSEVLPRVMELDESQEFPAGLVRRMGELGFLGAVAPVELGGAGMTATEFAIIMEEVARIDPSLALTFAGHSGLCLQHLLMHASDEQKKKYVPDLVTGKHIGSWCLTEPGSGSDSGGMTTTAVREGDHYVLNGTKTFITNGSHASTYVVLAKADASAGKSGISAFIVERGMGVLPGKKENKLGMRSSDTAQLTFDHVRVPRANLIGAEGEGFKQALKVLDSGRIGISALSVGLARGALDACLKYVKERKQFGKPLADFQATQFKVAEMATELEASRLMTYQAAAASAQGRSYAILAAQAKLFASETAQRIATEAVQIHGGYGFIKDFPVEKFYRDVKVLTIGEGTTEVQKIVIARSLLK